MNDDPIPAGYRVVPPRVNMAREVLDRPIEAGCADATAFVSSTERVSYAALNSRVRRLAQGLLDRGVRRGTAVLIRMPNCIEFVIAFLAIQRLGAIAVLQNSLLGPEEVEYVLEHSDAKGAITMDEVADPVRRLSSRLPIGLIVARGARDGELEFELAGSDDSNFTPADTAADDPAMIVYTSGTTGRPKGIVHAHRWIVVLGDSNRYRVPPYAGDVVLATGEWSFISALGHNVLFSLRNGSTGAILEGRAQPERVLEAIERLGVTLLYSVATVYRRILAIADVEKKYDLSSLRGCNSTGEALEEATWLEFKRRIGCDIWEHYGVSEMQMVLGQGPRQKVRPGSIGVPIPGTSVAVMSEDYRELPPGEIGQFLIKSDNPGFFIGYHKDARRTAEVVHDGWYHTGDLAYRDSDGYFWIAGRADDCFKSRGIFISPIEIENALRGHPAVVEACVVPMADREIGNRIRAVVVAREGFDAGPGLADEIRTALRQRIAPYKVPHTIEFRDSLPKSAVGKLLRRAVVEEPRSG